MLWSLSIACPLPQSLITPFIHCQSNHSVAFIINSRCSSGKIRFHLQILTKNQYFNEFWASLPLSSNHQSFRKKYSRFSLSFAWFPRIPYKAWRNGSNPIRNKYMKKWLKNRMNELSWGIPAKSYKRRVEVKRASSFSNSQCSFVCKNRINCSESMQPFCWIVSTQYWFLVSELSGSDRLWWLVGWNR